MPDRVLQNHNCVAALQHRLPYNVTMSLTANQQGDEAGGTDAEGAGPRRARARPCRAGLVVVALLGTAVLAAACGGRALQPCRRQSREDDYHDRAVSGKGRGDRRPV